MRKTLITLSLLLLLMVPSKSYALIVFDPTNFAKNVASYVKQGLQYITELGTKYSTGITAVQQTLSTVKQTITDPLKDAMTIIAIVNITKKNVTLVMGGLGNQALFKTDPEQYIKGKFDESKRASLGELANLSNKGGIYGDSILNKVVQDARDSTGLSAFTQSAIPGKTQKAICVDSALSAQAKNDVIKTDGTYNQSEFTARKQALYNTLCTCNPATDTKCAQTLMKVNAQIGGLDSLLAVTSGDNQFERSTRAALAVNGAAEAKKLAAKADLSQGGGIASQTRCTSRATSDVNGKPFSSPDLAPCLSEVITKGSAQLQKAYDDAIGAPLKTLQANLASSGSVLGSILRDVGDIIGTVGAFSIAVSSVTGDSGSSGGGSSGSRTVTSTSTSGTTVSRVSEAVEMDLTDPTKQAKAIKPMMKQIRPALAAIDELAIVNNDYLSKIAATKGNVLSLKTCYENLVKDHSGVSGDTRVKNAKTFYEGRLVALDALETEIKRELASLPAAKEKLNKFLADLNSTKSSETVGEIFDAYISQSDSGEVPDASTVIERKGDRDKLESDNETDLGPTGDISTMRESCVAIRTDLERAALNP